MPGAWCEILRPKNTTVMTNAMPAREPEGQAKAGLMGICHCGINAMNMHEMQVLSGVSCDKTDGRRETSGRQQPLQ